mmetsp:Transcript_28040/g.62540  ORF Transcript_28040/g.62540 Transcript_28040/m.62540 type:complete len:201 (-) Transcript_28040:412-1014(-)
MAAAAREVRAEPIHERERALRRSDFPQGLGERPVGHGAVRPLGLVLHAGLGRVEGQRRGAVHEPGRQGGADVQRHAVDHPPAQLVNLGLGHVVAAHLEHVHHHGPHHRRRHPGHVRRQALLGTDPVEPRENVGVVSSLGERESPVGLHPHQGHLDRVGEEGRGPAGEEAHAKLGRAPRVLLVEKLVPQARVDAQPEVPIG